MLLITKYRNEIIIIIERVNYMGMEPQHFIEEL